MSNIKEQYEHKLQSVLTSLNNLNYTFDDEGKLVLTYHSLNNRHIDMSKHKLLLELIYKYIKLNLYLRYDMKKTKIVPENKEYFWSSNLIEKTSSHLINKLIIVLNDRHNKAGVFSKANLLFDSIDNGCIFPLIEFTENKNFPLILLNPKRNIDEYLDNFWKIYIKNQLKYLHNIIIIVQGMSSIPLIKLLKNNKRDFEQNITKIVMINSKHKKYYQIFDEDLKIQFMNKCTNYILSSEPLGHLISSNVNSLE